MVEKYLTETGDLELRESSLLLLENRVLPVCKVMRESCTEKAHSRRITEAFQRGNPFRALGKLCELSTAGGCAPSERSRIHENQKELLLAIEKLAGDSSEFCEWFVNLEGGIRLLMEEVTQLLAKGKTDLQINEEICWTAFRVIYKAASNDSLQPAIKSEMDATLLMSLFNIWYE